MKMAEKQQMNAIAEVGKGKKPTTTFRERA